MAFRRSDQQRGCRYQRGGTSELKGIRIGWWEQRIYEKSPGDIEFLITTRYHLRPDLLSADLYGRDDLMWFVLQYNTIVDLHTEFVEGKTIMLPTRTRLFSQLLTNST